MRMLRWMFGVRKKDEDAEVDVWSQEERDEDAEVDVWSHEER